MLVSVGKMHHDEVQGYVNRRCVRPNHDARKHTDMQIPYTWPFVGEPATIHAFRKGSSTFIQQKIYFLWVGKFDEENALNVVCAYTLREYDGGQYACGIFQNCAGNIRYVRSVSSTSFIKSDPVSLNPCAHFMPCSRARSASAPTNVSFHVTIMR
jgi:hypothetical protein